MLLKNDDSMSCCSFKLSTCFLELFLLVLEVVSAPLVELYLADWRREDIILKATSGGPTGRRLGLIISFSFPTDFFAALLALVDLRLLTFFF